MNEKAFKISLAAPAAAINAGLWVAAYLAFPPAQDSVVLHYNLDVGVDFVGASRHIMLLPASGIALLAGNLILALLIARDDKRAFWTLWASAPVLQIILAGSLFLIWRANL